MTLIPPLVGKNKGSERLIRNGGHEVNAGARLRAALPAQDGPRAKALSIPRGQNPKPDGFREALAGHRAANRGADRAQLHEGVVPELVNPGAGSRIKPQGVSGNVMDPDARRNIRDLAASLR